MTPHYWNDARKYLIKKDKTLAKIIKEFPNQSIVKKGTAFKTLLRAIVGQQISVQSADAVWSRFIKLILEPTPSQILEFSVEELRSTGLSIQKANYVIDLANHFASGKIKPRTFNRLTDEQLINKLTSVKGIGQWTAEMFLIFNLQRPDILPLQDIGVIRAIEKHYYGGEKVDKSQLIEIGNNWAPWRSVATWYLWRSLDPVPVEY